MLVSTKQASEAFQIDGLGFALFIKLVEARVAQDVEDTQNLIRKEYENLANLEHNRDALLRGIRKDACATRIAMLAQSNQDKKRWIKNWIDQAWQQVSQIPGAQVHDLQAKSWSELEESFPENNPLWLKRFLILQEAILAPIYKGIEGYSDSLSEINIHSNCEKIARLFGFEREVGLAILTNTDDFVKGVTGYWSRVVKWTIGGTLVALLTAGIAAPAIATAVGGLMGLSGAAATSAGLAFFGGGAIAAGGLGMAGGFAVLVGGGGLLGATTGVGAAKLIHKLPTEVFIISSAKIINYIAFLKGYNKSNPSVLSSHIGCIKKEILEEFMRLKYTLELSLIEANGQDVDIEKTTKDIRTLQFTYYKLIGIICDQ